MRGKKVRALASPPSGLAISNEENQTGITAGNVTSADIWLASLTDVETASTTNGTTNVAISSKTGMPAVKILQPIRLI